MYETDFWDFICSAALSLNGFSQTTLSIKELVNGINWEWTESQFIYAFHPYIQAVRHTEWNSENSKCDFGLKNITIGDNIIEKSDIRVKRNSNKLYRIVLIVFEEETDITKIQKINDSLINEFGEPTKKTEERSQITNFVTTEIYWETFDYTVQTYHWNTIDKHLFSVTIEPPR